MTKGAKIALNTLAILGGVVALVVTWYAVVLLLLLALQSDLMVLLMDWIVSLFTMRDMGSIDLGHLVYIIAIACALAVTYWVPRLLCEKAFNIKPYISTGACLWICAAWFLWIFISNTIVTGFVFWSLLYYGCGIALAIYLWYQFVIL